MRARFQPKPRTHDRNLSFQDCTIGLFTILAPSREHDVWPLPDIDKNRLS
jgi:hypothetical protein